MNPAYPRPPGGRNFDRDAFEKRNVRHGYVKSFDGTRLFYSVEGEGKPLVFCYGIVCSSLHWTYQIEHFRKHYQTIWFDYRGHQNSELPADLNALTVEALTHDTKAVCDELGIRNAVFLGHSMGVNIVLNTARLYPELMSAMVLANGTATRPLETLFANNVMAAVFENAFQVYRRAPALAKKLWKLQRGNPLVHSLIGLAGFNPHLTPKEDVALYIDQMTDLDPGVLFYLIRNYNDFDATPWLHTIDKPTLIVAGVNDQITPLERQELLHQLIPGSEIQRIQHGSHCPQMDMPELVNLHIERFLEKLRY